MFLKKQKRLSYEEERAYQIQKSYNDIVDIAKANISGKALKEQLIVLDYLIRSITDEVCVLTANELLTQKTNGILPSPFPEICFDVSGNICNLRLEAKQLVDLSEVQVYVRPWNTDRMFRILKTINDCDFKYDVNNHSSVFYSDINLCYVYNGNHSINAGKYFKKGELMSKQFDMNTLYLNCKTDGLNWFDIHSGKVLCDVSDYRFAVIFTLAQLRSELKSGNGE